MQHQQTEAAFLPSEEIIKGKVTLIDCTGMGTPDPAAYAASILIYTKNTRLNMTPLGLADIQTWPEKRRDEELNYMSNTLPSSWEFVDYTFCIENVTRAFTHQLVRTRTASYAQQAMRVVDMTQGRGWEYDTGPTILENPLRQAIYDETMEMIAEGYRDLVQHGAKTEDARGLLPTNVLTNINMKIDMRNLVELIHKRQTLRVQDEYRLVLNNMKLAALSVHPWLVKFIGRTADNAMLELDQEINGIEDTAKRDRMRKQLSLIMSKV